MGWGEEEEADHRYQKAWEAQDAPPKTPREAPGKEKLGTPVTAARPRAGVQDRGGAPAGEEPFLRPGGGRWKNTPGAGEKGFDGARPLVGGRRGGPEAARGEVREKGPPARRTSASGAKPEAEVFTKRAGGKICREAAQRRGRNLDAPERDRAGRTRGAKSEPDAGDIAGCGESDFSRPASHQHTAPNSGPRFPWEAEALP